ncbi:VWD domain-containing protein [Desertimonas flava]|uniref:VWD domain-containing protein n=1 Tax=Desertimonas flava TaxID=2064846 RepID=UPI000E3483F5|nr:VWD domain-containing protein [Desertimonas flava]
MATRLLLAAAAMLVAACSSGDRAAPSTTRAATTEPARTEPPTTEPAAVGVIAVPEWEPQTRADELAFSMSGAGGVTVQDAVDAFALHVADFPGATRSSLPAGDTISLSYALSLLLPVRDELSAEQQAALDDYFAGRQVVGRVTADGAVVVDRPAGLRRPAAAEQKYEALLAVVRDEWKDKFPGHPEQDFYEVGWSNVPGESGMATNEFEDAAGNTVCVIWVTDAFRNGNPSDDKIKFFLAHEMFHCIQWRWALGVPGADATDDPFAEFPVRNPHAWLYDGSADWAAADLYRADDIAYNDIRPTWFSSSNDPLGSRSYDAWPLFETAHLQGYDVYAKIEAMHLDPSWTVARTLEIGGLDGVVFRMAWSSRTLRRAAWGDEWWMGWVWTGHESKPPVDNETTVSGIGIGTYAFEGRGDFSQPQLRVPVAAAVGLVTVAPVGAPIATHTRVGTRSVGDGSSGRFCFDPGQCACPPGQSAGAWPMEPGEMLFSFAASEDVPTSTLVAVEWDPDEECHEDDEPDEAWSNGDPHLVSFDGLAFDVVTLGEFVLARDPAGDFEVQTRHVPFGFGAGTAAVAVGDGTTRVTFTAPDLGIEAPVIRVDGVVDDRPEFTAGALRVAVGSDASMVAWPDGSTVRLHWYRGWFVSVTVPPARSARMEGLLGAADGDLRNDLRQADGTVVDTNVAAAHESPFALSWAVDESTTLFDYEPGQSVATFRIPHPRPQSPDLDPELIDGCAVALGERAAAHEVSSCAFDVAATGDEGFVHQYVAVVEDRADEPELADPVVERPEPPPAVSAAPPVAGVAGEPVLTLGAEDVATVAAVEGTVLLARIDSCDGAFVDLVVWRSSDREQLARAALCDPQQLPSVGLDDEDEWIEGEAYVWIPASGTYDVGMDFVLGDRALVGAVEVYLDPTPTVIRGDPTGSLVLDGYADTIVFLTDPAIVYETAGLDAACAVEAWLVRDVPDPEPYDLGACEHTAEIDFPPTDRPIPVVVFNRTAGPIEIALTPAT